MTAKPALRPVTPADRPFLSTVYASTRTEELAPLPWTDDQKAAFLQHQFEAQDQHYRTTYQDTSYDVILIDGEPAGRLYVGRWPGEIRVVDIALLPAHRDRGIATTLLRDLIAEADAAGKPLTIHVERTNPARALYERLGFRVAADRGVYLFMERPAS